jgi:hypothetical protein
MKIARLAMLYLDKEDASSFKKDWKIVLGEVTVKSIKIGKSQDSIKKSRVMLQASIELPKMPLKTKDGIICVPEQERKKTEHVIEMVSNFISIIEKCSRSISSPSPCLAFIPSNEKELEWLDDSSGIFSNRNSISGAYSEIEFGETILAVLLDRMDGAALMAEALASSHSGNKYREFIRLFECAFQQSSTQVERKLSQFLAGSELGYTREEIKIWLSYRHGAMHADGKKTNEIVLESDVKAYIPRMQQAAYDVLFNKKTWGNSSRERADNLPHIVATSNDENDLVITQGSTPTFHVQMFDDFQVYPMDLNAFINVLPDGLWSKWAA